MVSYGVIQPYCIFVFGTLLLDPSSIHPSLAVRSLPSNVLSLTLPVIQNQTELEFI